MCSIICQIGCFVMLCFMIVLCVLFSRQCVTLLVRLGVLLCYVFYSVCVLFSRQGVTCVTLLVRFCVLLCFVS